jgi:hypothetical protein
VQLNQGLINGVVIQADSQKAFIQRVVLRLTFLYIPAMLVCNVMLKLYTFLHTNWR